MQSESLHKVSEHLSDRHPYLQEPFPQRIFPLEVAAAHGHRAFPKLIAVLQRPEASPETVADALETAHSLLTTQESRIEAVNAGLVPAVTPFLSRRNVAFEVRAWACSCLASVATLSAGKAAMRDMRVMEDAAAGAGVVGGGGAGSGGAGDEDGDGGAGGSGSRRRAAEITPCVPAAGALLRHPRVECRTAAALVLSRLSETSDGASLVVGAGCVPDLCTALADADVEVVSRCLSALVRATRLDAGLTAALAAGIVPELCRLMAVAELVFDAASALANVATHPRGKAVCAEGGAVETLAPLLVDVDSSVRRAAAGALMHIAICVEGKVAIAEFAAENLVRALFDQDPGTKRNATRCIRYTSEFLEARREFEFMLSDDPDLLKEVFDDENY